MIHFHRTEIYELVYGILTASDYDMLGDDAMPAKPDFRVNDHPGIWYVVAGWGVDPIGLFSLFPQNAVCWDVHVAMLPWVSTHQKWAAARGLVPWLADNTECKRLTAAVPAINRKALVYGTHGLGMHYVGRQHKAFLKCGLLRDLIILGRSLGS